MKLREPLGRVVTRARAGVAVPAASLWLISYLVVAFTGHGFDSGYLRYGWQLIPWETLSADPLVSVWNLHIQPPFWNLLLGLVGWATPFPIAVSLQLVMLVFGLTGVGLAAILARDLGLSRRWSVGVAVAVYSNPEILRGAFEPTYELPVGVLLTALVLIAVRARRPERADRWLVLGSAIATSVIMTRSLYHPVWALVIVAIIAHGARGRVSARSVAMAFVIPIVVAGGWMTKNEILFDRATMSSWFGMNLERAVLPILPKAELDRMVSVGELDPIASEQTFASYETYRDLVEPCSVESGHPSLAEAARVDAEIPNFNYECFLPVYDEAYENAMTVARSHPRVWVEGRVWSLRASMAISTAPQRSGSIVMRGLDSVYSIARLDVGTELSTSSWGTQIYGPNTTGIRMKVGVVYVGFHVVVLMCGLALASRRVRRGLGSLGPIIGLVSFLAWYTTLVGAVGELGEQARFRTMIDPIVIIVAVVTVRRVAVRSGRTRQSQARSVGR